MADLSFSDRAYVKIVLHAAKYPHCSVNGVLIAEDSKKKDAKSVHIVDAVPFFHQSLTLAPMLEVALTQVGDYIDLDLWWFMIFWIKDLDLISTPDVFTNVD